MNLEKQKENFKNHRAIFKDLGNIKILDFKIIRWAADTFQKDT